MFKRNPYQLIKNNSYLPIITWAFARRNRLPWAHPHVPIITNHWYHEGHLCNSTVWTSGQKILSEFTKSLFALILWQIRCYTNIVAYLFPKVPGARLSCKQELTSSIDRFLSITVLWWGFVEITAVFNERHLSVTSLHMQESIIIMMVCVEELSFSFLTIAKRFQTANSCKCL